MHSALPAQRHCRSNGAASMASPVNHMGHVLPASGRRSASQTCCSADCRCLSWAASPGRVSSSRCGLPHQGHRDTSLSPLFLPSMDRGWSRAPSCPRQEGNCARGELDLGKEAGLELNSTLLPHSHHAPPQGSPSGPLGPFASWEVALRGLSGSVLSRRTSFQSRGHQDRQLLPPAPGGPAPSPPYGWRWRGAAVEASICFSLGSGGSPVSSPFSLKFFHCLLSL